MVDLEVPGASLYYESVGQGPMLFCISGADGSCEIRRKFAECLKEHFAVVMWDRRRFSRGYLNGFQDYEHRPETDVDDAVLIIKHLAPSALATVIGNSAVAIVALRLLTRHPDLIRTLASYEPPAAKLLPDFDAIWAQHEEIYATYRAHGILPAMMKFAQLTKVKLEWAVLVRVMDPRNEPYISSNVQYWFEREFMVCPQADFDAEGELRPLKGKLMLVSGELSPREAYYYRGNVVLGERFVVEVMHVPGEHVGHATRAEAFAEKLRESLEGGTGDGAVKL